MMMLIFSIIVMCSYLYSYLSQVLTKTYFKEHPSVVGSKYGLCNMENNLNYVQYLNIVLMKKAWFMAPMEYNPNGKGIMAPMK